MTPYEVHVPAAEGKLMSRIKSETMIDSLYFNEENERYEVPGDSGADHDVAFSRCRDEVRKCLITFVISGQHRNI
jgi:hypothetical protein